MHRHHLLLTSTKRTCICIRAYAGHAQAGQDEGACRGLAWRRDRGRKEHCACGSADLDTARPCKG